MSTQQSKLPRERTWNSYRYLTLVHAALLSTSLSVTALAAPKSAKIVAIRKADGKALAAEWLWRTESAAAGSAVILEDTAVFVEDQQLLKMIDLRTGKLRWQTKLEVPITCTPLTNETMALVYTRDQVWAYSLAKGDRLWLANLADMGGTWSLSEKLHPIVGDDMIFVSSGRRVAALLTQDGSLHWMYESHKIKDGQLPVAGIDRLYVRTRDPEQPWLALALVDGTLAGGEGAIQDNPRPEKSPFAVTTPSGSRRTISQDRRTLTVWRGPRSSWKYQVPAPFTIAGIVGETDDAICIQIVERTAAPAKAAPDARRAAVPAK